MYASARRTFQWLARLPRGLSQLRRVKSTKAKNRYFNRNQVGEDIEELGFMGKIKELGIGKLSLKDIVRCQNVVKDMLRVIKLFFVYRSKVPDKS